MIYDYDHTNEDNLRNEDTFTKKTIPKGRVPQSKDNLKDEDNLKNRDDLKHAISKVNITFTMNVLCIT